MMYRRLFGYEDNEVEECEKVRTHLLPKKPESKVLQEGLGLPSLETLPSLLEPFLRRVVREEVERIQTRYFSSLKSGTRISVNQIDGAVTSKWQLQFRSKLPHTLFTGSRIETDQNCSVQVAIVDSSTNQIISSGPLASLKIDIVAVDGDFCPDEKEDWTEQDFSNCLLRQREGKPQLLTGDLVVTLDGGIGYLGDLYFTDNSSWIRSRKFRLGLRVQKCSPYVGRVREGLSEAFLVKDHRGESYKKHHPPSPDDEVWRLEKIGKDGAFHRRLAEKKICTVRDFLRLLVINQEVLRNILGNGMSNKIWEATIQHAWECNIEEQLCYWYHFAEQQVTLYFDSILRVVGIKFESSSYESFSELPDHLKALVDGLKKQVYQNHSNMVEFGKLTPSTAGPLRNFEDACSALDHANSIPQVTREEETDNQVSIMDWPGCNSELHEDPYQQKANVHMHQHYLIQQESCLINNFGFAALPQHNGNPPFTDEWNGPTCPTFDDESTTRKQCLSFTSDLDLSNGCLQSAGREQHCGGLALPKPAHSGSLPKRSKWIKLLTTLKCGMSIRKRVAAKRRARLSSHVSYQMYSHVPNMFESF